MQNKQIYFKGMKIAWKSIDRNKAVLKIGRWDKEIEKKISRKQEFPEWCGSISNDVAIAILISDHLFV